MKNKNLLIAGGAGFIGSHMIDLLLDSGHKIVCVDDLSLGKKEHLESHMSDKNFKFIKHDILEVDELNRIFKEYKIDCVFHLAANSDIQLGASDLNVDMQKTFLTTFNIIKCMKSNNVKEIVFSSTSAVYGEMDGNIGEDRGPLFPVSFYGAAKLASEAYISAASTNFGIRAWIIRFPNVVGERTTHGAVRDFISRLKVDPKNLRILGDGTQEKPYTYVKDLVRAIKFIWENSKKQLNYFNIGVSSATTVQKIAQIVVEEMGLKDVTFKYTGGKIGWVGDVPKFRYNLSKIKKLGWKASMTSDEAIRHSVKQILNKGI